MKPAALALLFTGCLFLSGCSLLPEEETFRSAPVIRNASPITYELAECTRADLQLTVKIFCYYIPVRTETLSFNVAGVPYEDIAVSVGDLVKKGDLLVQLQSSDIENELKAEKIGQEELLLRLEHLKQDHELALERIQVEQLGGEAFDRENAQYLAERQSLEDKLEISSLRIESCEKKLEERRLYAPMDGTVTWLRKPDPDDTSVPGISVASIADSTKSIFKASTEYADYLLPGQIYTIVSGGKEYNAAVVSAEELGITPDIPMNSAKRDVYFELTEPCFDLEDKDMGSFTLLLDGRKDALCIPEKAVSTINGETVVYYQDVDGFKSFKNAQFGLCANSMIEVISGLDEGDIVIVG